MSVLAFTSGRGTVPDFNSGDFKDFLKPEAFLLFVVCDTMLLRAVQPVLASAIAHRMTVNTRTITGTCTGRRSRMLYARFTTQSLIHTAKLIKGYVKCLSNQQTFAFGAVPVISSK